jgi:hypothetical protein
METFLKKNLLDGLTPTFTRASIATKITSQGIEEAAIDEIRIDPVRGFLLEEESTNIFTYSEGDLAQYTIVSNVQNAATTIVGFTDSIEYYQSGVDSYAYKSYALTTALAYTYSAFIEMDDGDPPIPGADSSSGDFSIAMDSILASDFTIKHIINSIYRVNTTHVAIAGTQFVGIVKYTNQSSRTFRISGIQLEQNAFATSYIKTRTSSVVRDNDVLTYQVGGGKFPQEFQIAMTFTPLADGADYSILSLFGTDDSNGYEIRTLGATTPDFEHDDIGGSIFTIDTDLLIQDTANEYVFTAVQNDTNVRGIIQSNYATEYNDVKAGTLNHSDLGEFQIGRYNTTRASGYYKNLRLYSKD